MKKTLQALLITMYFACGLQSCTSEQPQKNEAVQANENFSEFYKRFLTDDEFQKERIIFPLKGRYMQNEIAGLTDDTTDRVMWTEANWKPIHKIDESAMKDVKVSKSITDSVVIVKTEGVTFNFLFEETYKKQKGLWYLTSLVDISM